jgi:acyl-CoA thioester hydrolase
MQIRIFYEDTDAGGIVYHTNYLKYCERARSEPFFQKGIHPTDGKESGFVVRHIDANFLGMARLGDIVEVRSELIKKRNASIMIKQSIFKGDEKIFEMNVTLAFVRDGGKPKRIPTHLLETIINSKS